MQPEQKSISIQGIPAVLWGPQTGKLFLAVHGDGSHKRDTVIQILAEEAAQKGYGTLSFDLPEHGGRKNEPTPCKVQNCVAELQTVLSFAQSQAKELSLFGCSIGAYFSMLAYKEVAIRQALFLSPVVDMRRIIQNMMGWFGITEERLQREGEIQTSAKTLYWDYYTYVKEQPVQWNIPTAVLYGKQDTLCEAEYVQSYVQRFGADLTVVEEGEHFFHTEWQLNSFARWLREHIGA